MALRGGRGRFRLLPLGGSPWRLRGVRGRLLLLGSIPWPLRGGRGQLLPLVFVWRSASGLLLLSGRLLLFVWPTAAFWAAPATTKEGGGGGAVGLRDNEGFRVEKSAAKKNPN